MGRGGFMYCAKCKSEYRDGIEVCPECGCLLEENIPEKEEIEPDLNEKGVEVYNAADEFEADIVVAKLKAEGIYAYKTYKGIDSYNKILLGRTLLGVKVIVGEKDSEEAKIILSDCNL